MTFGIFDVIGLFLALYICRAAMTGEVFAKAGAWGSTISRDEAPGRFWTVIAIYAALSVVLITLF